MNDITEAARRNPMQAVAVGASVADPLIRFARAILMPILMIGAGLFSAGSKTGGELWRKILKDFGRAPKSLIAGLPTDDGGQWTM